MILSILIGLPLAGAGLVLLVPRDKAAKALALLVSAAVFFLSVRLTTGFDLSAGGFQFKEQVPLLPRLGIQYSVGLDGLSLWLVLLTTLLTPLVVWGGFASIQKSVRGYYACVLFLESSVLGTFLSTDLFLFYLFWELMLIPAFFLIGMWGGENRVKATFKFVLFTMAGSLLMLVGLLYVTHEARTFDYAKMLEHAFSEDDQFWCFLAFALAFIIKVPVVPFHAWLPDAYAEAPAGGTVLLSSVLVKLGAYGLLRFCIPLFPAAAKAFAPWLMVLGVAGVIHGALMASFQTNFKRLAAYSSLSHMGLIVLGIFTFSLTGLQGSLLQMVSHGVYMAGLFLLMGMMRERGASDETADYGGMASSAPVLSAFFLWFLAAGVGFPGFNGFVGEILILLSAYKAWPLLALASLTAFVLGAWYWFTLYNRLFFGPPGKGKGGKWTDLSFREIAVLLPLAALALWMGLGPNRFLRPMEKSLQLSVLERLKPPPAMTDFAAQQRRMQDEVDKDKARGGK